MAFFLDIGKKVGNGFSKEGFITQFVEKTLPGGGLVTAGIHELAGNNSHAKQAAARGLNTATAFAAPVAAVTAVVMTGGAALPLVAAGAVAGAAGAAAGNGLQVAVEQAYNKTDKDTVGQEACSKAPADWAVDAAGGALEGGVGGVFQHGFVHNAIKAPRFIGHGKVGYVAHKGVQKGAEQVAKAPLRLGA